ncbi:MAG: hypothetical protein WBW33_08335 [Bryobacteraceae bacterium]
MGVIIKNLSSRPLYVPLHNGQSIRLAAGASACVDDVLVKDSVTVEKLVQQRVIAIDAKADNAEPAKSETTKPKKAASDGPQTR